MVVASATDSTDALIVARTISKQEPSQVIHLIGLGRQNSHFQNGEKLPI